VTINFHFNLTPVAFLGDNDLRSVRCRRSDGNPLELPAQLAVTCIGYETVACCTVTPSNGVFPNEGGKVKEGLYVVGWAKRGPSGTIPTNRTEAQQVAQRIAADLPGARQPSQAELAEFRQRRGTPWVDYSGWKCIEAVERAGADQTRCLLKLLKTEEMLQASQERELRPA